MGLGCSLIETMGIVMVAIGGGIFQGRGNNCILDRTSIWDYLSIHFPQMNQVTLKLKGRGRTREWFSLYLNEFLAH